MGWFSRLMGNKGQGPALVEAGRSAPEGESDGTASAGHAEILVSLRGHLAASIAKNGTPLRADQIHNDVDLYEAGYLESLAASRFLVFAEKEYHVLLPDWLLGGHVNTLDRLATYIENQLSLN